MRQCVIDSRVNISTSCKFSAARLRLSTFGHVTDVFLLMNRLIPSQTYNIVVVLVRADVIAAAAARRSWFPTVAAQHRAAAVVRCRPRVALYRHYPGNFVARK